MKIKKILAALLSTAMFVSVIPANTFAYDFTSNEALQVLKTGVNEDTIPTLSLICIESDGATTPMPKVDGNGNYVTISDITTLAGGTSFFVGIRADNFTNFLHNDEGTYMWGTGVTYDPNYVTWEPTNSRGAATNFQKRIHDENKFEFTEYQTYALGNYATKTTEPNADVPSNCTMTASILVQYNDSTSDDYMYVLPDSEYLGFLEFKVKSGDENTVNGKTIFDFSKSDTDTYLQFGSSGDYAYTYNNNDSKLHNYLKLDTSNVDIFPAGVETLSSINVSGTPTLSYVEGQAFNPSGLAVTPTTSAETKTAIEPTVTDYKDLKFYVEASDSLDETTITKTRELTTNTELTINDDNGKYIYVAYTLGGVTKVGCLGQLTITAKALTSIAIKSTGDDATTFGTGTYYTTTNVTEVLTRTTNPEKLTVTITYNNGDTEDVAYAAFADKGLALYKVDADSKLQAVTDTDKFAATNTFYVAETGKAGTLATDVNVKTNAIEPTATIDTIVIKSATGAKLKYATDEDTAGDKRNVIDFSGLTLGINNKSDASDVQPTNKTLEQVGANNVIFYYGDSDAAAYDAAKTITSGTTEYTSDLKDKYVFVIPADDTLATPVLVGQLGDRAIDTTKTTTVGGPVNGATAAATYGDTLGDGMTLTVTYDNGDTKELSYNDFTTEGVTMKIDGVAVDKDTVLTPAMSTKKVEFYVGDTKIGESTALTVNNKTVKVVLDNPTAPEKVYNGDTDVEADDVTALNVKINASDLLVADSAFADKIGVSGLTFTYEDKNAGSNKAINATGTAVAAANGEGTNDDVTDFNSKYTLVLDDNFTNAVTGTITAATLNITEITGVPSVEVGATEGLTGTATLALSKINSTLVDGDVVTLTYKYDYTNADVSTAGKPVVAITASGTEGNVTLGLSGTDAGNYTLGTLPTETKGEVSNKVLSSITINTAPKAEYTYPDTKLNVTDIKFNLNYEGAADATVIDLAQFIADGGIITLTDAANQTQTITVDNAEDVISLAYGTTKLSISYAGKTAETAVTVNRKPIKLSEITFNASKVYGETDITKTASAADGVIEAVDADNVQFTFDAVFTDEAAGENKEVTISNIALTGDASDNYVIVDDNSAQITAATTTTINTGIISQGEQILAANPTATVDENTNNIVVNLDGENLEFSIDGTNWQDSKTFTDLAKGTEYTIQARIKATEDGNYASSEPKTVTITTYKYHVTRTKKGASKITDGIYTSLETVTTTDINTNVFAKKPSSFKAYFTDSTCKEAIPEPLQLTAETALYYTTSGGGGGSNITTYTVKFDAGKNGEITEGKASVSVNSGAKMTSSSVPTVTAKEGYKFLGWSLDGETTVNPTAAAVTKAVTYTALYEEETVEPTPTPTPTDKPEPVINENYTKPYASGYEDTSFRPENNITRAELAAMIARLSYGDDIPEGMYESSFPDVSADAWFNKYVGYLEGLDVLSGYEDGTFRPYNTVTRGEIATVIARAQRFDLIPYAGLFTDITDSDWAKDYIQTLADKNIVSGYANGTFGPYSPLTRAEAVTMINNVLAPSTAVVTFTPNDIAGHWAEANIMLAVNERQLNGAEITEPEPVEIPDEVIEPVEGTENTEEDVNNEEAEVPAE